MIQRSAILASLAFVLIGLPTSGRAQYIDPVCEPWQEVQGNGCRTNPVPFAIGGAACMLPTAAFVVLTLRRRRSAGRGD